MPKFWEYFGKSSPKHRNLQEGLFQIASQTCNLLVQVNNTNNISFGDNATNILSNTLETASFGGYSGSSEDREQLVVLLPPTNVSRGSRFKNTGGLLKPRLSVRQHRTILRKLLTLAWWFQRSLHFFFSCFNSLRIQNKNTWIFLIFFVKLSNVLSYKWNFRKCLINCYLYRGPNLPGTEDYFRIKSFRKKLFLNYNTLYLIACVFKNICKIFSTKHKYKILYTYLFIHHRDILVEVPVNFLQEFRIEITL